MPGDGLSVARRLKTELDGAEAELDGLEATLDSLDAMLDSLEATLDGQLVKPKRL